MVNEEVQNTYRSWSGDEGGNDGRGSISLYTTRTLLLSRLQCYVCARGDARQMSRAQRTVLPVNSAQVLSVIHGIPWQVASCSTWPGASRKVWPFGTRSTATLGGLVCGLVCGRPPKYVDIHVLLSQTEDISSSIDSTTTYFRRCSLLPSGRDSLAAVFHCRRRPWAVFVPRVHVFNSFWWAGVKTILSWRSRTHVEQFLKTLCDVFVRIAQLKKSTFSSAFQSRCHPLSNMKTQRVDVASVSTLKIQCFQKVVENIVVFFRFRAKFPICGVIQGLSITRLHATLDPKHLDNFVQAPRTSSTCVTRTPRITTLPAVRRQRRGTRRPSSRALQETANLEDAVAFLPTFKLDGRDITFLTFYWLLERLWLVATPPALWGIWRRWNRSIAWTSWVTRRCTRHTSTGLASTKRTSRRRREARKGSTTPTGWRSTSSCMHAISRKIWMEQGRHLRMTRLTFQDQCPHPRIVPSCWKDCLTRERPSTGRPLREPRATVSTSPSGIVKTASCLRDGGQPSEITFKRAWQRQGCSTKAQTAPTCSAGEMAQYGLDASDRRKATEQVSINRVCRALHSSVLWSRSYFSETESRMSVGQVAISCLRGLLLRDSCFAKLSRLTLKSGLFWSVESVKKACRCDPLHLESFRRGVVSLSWHWKITAESTRWSWAWASAPCRNVELASTFVSGKLLALWNLCLFVRLCWSRRAWNRSFGTSLTGSSETSISWWVQRSSQCTTGFWRISQSKTSRVRWMCVSRPQPLHFVEILPGLAPIGALTSCIQWAPHRLNCLNCFSFLWAAFVASGATSVALHASRHEWACWKRAATQRSSQLIERLRVRVERSTCVCWSFWRWRECHSEKHRTGNDLRGNRGDACRQGSLRRALSAQGFLAVLGSHPRLSWCVLSAGSLLVDGSVQINTIGGRVRCIGGSACWRVGGLWRDRTSPNLSRFDGMDLGCQGHPTFALADHNSPRTVFCVTQGGGIGSGLPFWWDRWIQSAGGGHTTSITLTCPSSWTWWKRGLWRGQYLSRGRLMDTRCTRQVFLQLRRRVCHELGKIFRWEWSSMLKQSEQPRCAGMSQLKVGNCVRRVLQAWSSAGSAILRPPPARFFPESEVVHPLKSGSETSRLWGWFSKRPDAELVKDSYRFIKLIYR